MRQLLRTIMLLFVRWIGAPRAWQATRKGTDTTKTTPRILLVRPDHLGDLVLTTPVIAALRAQLPQAHITMLVGPWSREVVARHPALDNVEICNFPGFQRAAQHPLAPYPLLFKLARQLRRERYDLAINLRPDFWWGAALLYLAAIPRRVGYALPPGRPFLTHTLTFHTPEHATYSNLRLASAALQALQAPALAEPLTSSSYPLHFVPMYEETFWLGMHLAAEGVAERTPLVVIHPGTGGAVKLWRAEGWSRCADWLANEATFFTTSAQIILTGTPKELPLLQEIAQGMQEYQRALIYSELSVGQLAALLQRAQLVLGVDNGPLHLAVAQKTPTVQIFGPTDVRIFGPWGDPANHAVITATQRCASCATIPCGRLDFAPEELAAHPCVKLVSEQELKDTITHLLQKQNVKPSPHP